MSKTTNGNNKKSEKNDSDMEAIIDQITNKKELWEECKNTISGTCIDDIKDCKVLDTTDTEYLKRLLGVVEYKKSIQSSISQQTFALSLVVLSVLGLNTSYFQNLLQAAFNFSFDKLWLNVLVLIFNLLIFLLIGLLSISLLAGIFSFIREGIYPEYKLITIELAITEIIEEIQEKSTDDSTENT